jgi:hypothetical protein
MQGNSRLAGLTAIVLLAGASACHATPQNPLVGRWTISEATNDCVVGPQSDIEFTPTGYTSAYDNHVRTIAVTYNVSPGKVYVLTDTGLAGAVGYTILGPNEMRIETWALCKYRRIG